MTENKSVGTSDTKIVEKQKDPETVLFLYQPQGIEDSVVGAKRVMWQEVDASTASGRRIEMVSIARGINLVSYPHFLRITEDPECNELFRKRSLIKICDGSNPFAATDRQEGVYGTVADEKVIERTFRVDLLEGWENWLQQQNWEQDKSRDYKLLIQAVRDRIGKLGKEGKSMKPSYNPDYPEAVSTNSRLELV